MYIAKPRPLSRCSAELGWVRKTKFLPAGDPTRWGSLLDHYEPPPFQPTQGDDPRVHQRGSFLISLTRSAREPLARVGQPWQEILVKVGVMGRSMNRKRGPQQGRLVVVRPSPKNGASARQTLVRFHFQTFILQSILLLTRLSTLFI